MPDNFCQPAFAALAAFTAKGQTEYQNLNFAQEIFSFFLDRLK
jgi:hypothetical protein